MDTLKMTTRVTLLNEKGGELDQETLVKAYYDMQRAVQNRLFADGAFDENVIVESYEISDCWVQ